jgi:hypothetical protein
MKHNHKLILERRKKGDLMKIKQKQQKNKLKDQNE